MRQSLLIKHVLPFFNWFALMILIAVGIDYLLHYFHWVFVGRYLGYVGTFVIIFSFVYSLRKRKLIQVGSPKQLLQTHEYMAWAGSIMIIVHAGIHFNALLPWLALLMLLINVASGLVGKYLLKSANEALAAKRKALIDSGNDKESTDRKLFFDAIMVDAMKKWRVVHLPISLLLALLSLVHIVSVIMFSK
ncbi:MAG: hypothetical protein IT258_23325 [Saprospiraceae bacterium]|nr:hypothetical protein [Saprospiraceae bacterium]